MWFFLLLVCAAIAAYFYFDHKFRLEKVEDLKKKCVVITGCDGGIGAALAQRLDSLGVTIFACCQTEKGANELKLRVSGRLRTIVADIGNTQHIPPIVEAIKTGMPENKELWGFVTAEVNMGPGGPMEFNKRVDYQSLLSKMALGPIELLTSLMTLLKATRDSRVVFSTNATHRVAPPLNSAAVMTNSAIEGFADVFRREKQVWGIKCSTVVTGRMKTDHEKWQTEADTRWSDVSPDVKEDYGEEFHKKWLADKKAEVDRMEAADISAMIEAYEHALLAKNPRTHYLLSRETMLYSFVACLPGIVGDPIVHYLFKSPKPRAVLLRQ